MEKCKYYLCDRKATDAARLTGARFTAADGRVIISELDLRDMLGAGITVRGLREITEAEARQLKLENHYRIG